jgi:cytochrome oxidase Cu insertion factor (SCO1/SenC/PrrC family)
MGLRTTIVATMILLLCLGLALPAGAAYQVGDHVNNFTLPDAYGNSVSLYDYQDCIVLLPFWYYG